MFLEALKTEVDAAVVKLGSLASLHTQVATLTQANAALTAQGATNQAAIEALTAQLHAANNP